MAANCVPNVERMRRSASWSSASKRNVSAGDVFDARTKPKPSS